MNERGLLPNKDGDSIRRRRYFDDNQQDVVMEDKENNIPGTNPHRSSGVLRLARLRRNHDRNPRNPAQPLLPEKYKNVKRKFEEADKENKRLKTELTESNAKLESITRTEFFRELKEVAVNLVPPIHDVFKSLADPVLRGNLTPGDPVLVQPFEHTKNPFEIDLVLREVFSYLGGKQLKTARLVNSIWNSNAGSRFKDTHSQILLRNSRTITKFAQRMVDSKEFPYSRFLIKSEFGPRFATQFQKIGHHVKVLTLMGKKNQYNNRVPFPQDMTLSNVLNVIRLTPHLETLELSGLQFAVGFVQPPGFGQVQLRSLKNLTLRIDDNGLLSEQLRALQNNQIVSQTLRRIISAAPELSSLKLQVFGRRLLTTILRTVGEISTLRHLEFESCVGESQLEHLVQGVFSLTSLKFIVHLDDCRLLQDFLTSQAGTLHRLELHVSTFNTRLLPAATFPVFPKLNYLKFISAFANNQSLPFQRGGNEFPVLQDLWTTSDLFRHYFPKRFPNPTVQSLTCEYRKKPLSWHIGDGLTGVKESFPNAKKIHVKSPSSLVTELILKNSGDFLEHLVIDYFNGDQTNIDSMLTGFPYSHWLTNQFKRLDDTPVLIRLVVANFFRASAHTGLHELKHLKRLEIRCSDDSRNKLTDLSGYITLLSMHSLEYLAIYNSDLSGNCIDELRKRHKTVVIKTLSKAEQKAYTDAHSYH